MTTPKTQAGSTAAKAGAGTSDQGNVLTGTPPVGTATIAPDASTAPAAGPAAGTPDTAAAQAGDEVAKKAADLVETVAATAAQPTSTVATTKVKMLRNHPRVGAFADTVTDLPTDLATELVRDKYAVRVSGDDNAAESQYGQPSTEQLKAASAAYGRFRAVVETGDEISPMPEFDVAPENVQRAFVAAIDPTYGPQ